MFMNRRKCCCEGPCTSCIPCCIPLDTLTLSWGTNALVFGMPGSSPLDYYPGGYPHDPFGSTAPQWGSPTCILVNGTASYTARFNCVAGAVKLTIDVWLTAGGGCGFGLLVATRAYCYGAGAGCLAVIADYTCSPFHLHWNQSGVPGDDFYVDFP
jgi:hypothetical protein